jgi:hypothetical protein
MARVLELIWGKWEQKYFSENQKKDSTRLSTDRPSGKSVDLYDQVVTRLRCFFDGQVAVAAGIQVALIPLGDRDDETDLRADADGAFLE